MIGRIVLIFLLAAVAQAQGATEVQGAQIKGSVILELLGQAAAAFRSHLEVYTTEAFPFCHEQAQDGIEGMQEAAYTG